MPRFQLRLRASPRGEALDDDGEGQRLVELVCRAVAAGGAPIVGVAVRVDRVDIVELPPGGELPLPLLLAGLTRSTADGAGPVEAVGVMGVAAKRAGEGTAPLAVVFLEWSDCRWWSWRAAVDASERQVRLDTAVVNRAVDGDPLPGRLGRWWSLGRRRGMSVHLSGPPDGPLVPGPETSLLVH